MRSKWLVIVLLSASAAGCRLTGPESCTSANTITGATGTLRDAGGVELGNVRVVVQRFQGDTMSAWYRMVTESPGIFLSPLANHVVAASLVGPGGETVYDITLDRKPVYIADSVMPIRDAKVIADLETGLAQGTLTLVLTTDLSLGVLRTPLAFNNPESGYHAPLCIRTGGLFSD